MSVSKKNDLDGGIEQRKNTISDSQYCINLTIMTIQWSVVSFTFYLLLASIKYFEGSIYVNYYLDACAAILGTFSSILLYPVRIRWSFIISITFSLIGGIFVLVF